MLKIGLISDTHSFLDPAVSKHFADRDEIWHAGDFGSVEVVKELEKMAPLKGVYGNIDGQEIRTQFPLHNRFEADGVDVWITHIGGVPGRYCFPIRDEIEMKPPDLFICGHSHILKIERDKSLNNMIYLNPGAAGRQGFQRNRTIVRFSIETGKLKNMEVIILD